MELTITQADLKGKTNYVLSCFYPNLKEVVHFGYNDRKQINRDPFMIGIWKIKKLK